MCKLLEPIEAYCADHGLAWDACRADQMGRYLDLLIQFNESRNLIGPLNRDEAVDELLVDSLTPAAARAPRGPILDVGTGAGLPGIPLKILFPTIPLTLVEPRQKRSTFLKIATHRLGLEEVTVVRTRIEEFDEFKQFDLVVSKAFQAPTEWLRTAQPFISAEGAIICMARHKNRQALLEQARHLGLTLGANASRGDASPEQRVCFAFE